MARCPLSFLLSSLILGLTLVGCAVQKQKIEPVPIEKAPPVEKPVVKEEAPPVAEPVDSDNDGIFDDVDLCPETTLGIRVDLTGCPADTDGDGVLDFEDACTDTPKGTLVDEQGCPVVREPVKTLTLHINFGAEKATVTPFHYEGLQRAADFIRRYPGSRVEVVGYTDDTGADQLNRELSALRAENVRNTLIERYGVKPAQITSRGAGESKPVASNDTEEGRIQNRRVEIRILSR